MLEIGTIGEAAYVADDDDMASSFCIGEQDVFPQVFSTARMIALMETAGARALKPLLQPGQLSVGVTVNIKHLAATPNHTQVSAKATRLALRCRTSRTESNHHETGMGRYFALRKHRRTVMGSLSPNNA
jgi:predicted thioesterase